MNLSRDVLRLWIDAARPKTLTASLSPVILGSALAYRDGVFAIWPTLFCLLVALSAQIASNFANDYFDFQKGADTKDRLGPERAVASGKIKPISMLKATSLTLAFTCFFGCLLLFWGGWKLVFVGVFICVGVLAYSAGPYPLAYNGLGDLCVLIFYGIVPVCFTYYIQAQSHSVLALVLSVALGLLSVNILIVNNYRDYYQDKAAKKRTTIVLFGRRFGRLFYLINGIVALALVLFRLADGVWWHLFLLGGFIPFFMRSWLELGKREGRELNATLASTARNLLLFTVILAVILVFR